MLRMDTKRYIELKLKTMVAVHCLGRDHLEHEFTYQLIKESYKWYIMKQEARELVQACINHLISQAGERISPVLAVAIRGQISTTFSVWTSCTYVS